MPRRRVVSEQERQAAGKVEQQEGTVNWLSLVPHVTVLRLVERERREEEARANENMLRIAEIDRANAARRELKKLAAQVPAVETGASAETDIAIDKANRRRQTSRPDGWFHLIVQQEIIPERRLERELYPKPRKPAEESWRTRLTAGRHWQDAIKWFKMTPAEKTAAEAEISDAVNTEIGVVAVALTAQAEWNELEANGEAKQLDFSGFHWP